ncbi:GIP [Symbiodinium sp. CCMP2592]|nr:GIP [Symbiodinium sp. CCMP2592]
MPLHSYGTSGGLSVASRYGALQRVFNDKLREWHWQRSTGTMFQVWQPPGVIFGCLKKEHYAHGRKVPAWEDWGFGDRKVPCRLVIRALAGRWILWKAMQQRQESWILADGDDSHLFNAFLGAMDFYNFDALEPEGSFPNLRLLYAHARTSMDFFPPFSLRSIHVHLPWAERTSKPKRAALISPKFIVDASNVLEARGEFHIVADDEELMQQACACLTKSRLFGPSLPFPFHVEGLPASYPGEDRLRADQQIVTGRKSSSPLFYSAWEKRPPQHPNFRFKGGATPTLLEE